MADITLTVGLERVVDFNKFKNNLKTLLDTVDNRVIHIKIETNVADVINQFKQLNAEIEKSGGTHLVAPDIGRSFSKGVEDCVQTMQTLSGELKEVSKSLTKLSKDTGKADLDGIFKETLTTVNELSKSVANLTTVISSSLADASRQANTATRSLEQTAQQAREAAREVEKVNREIGEKKVIDTTPTPKIEKIETKTEPTGPSGPNGPSGPSGPSGPTRPLIEERKIETKIETVIEPVIPPLEDVGKKAGEEFGESFVEGAKARVDKLKNSVREAITREDYTENYSIDRQIARLDDLYDKHYKRDLPYKEYDEQKFNDRVQRVFDQFWPDEELLSAFNNSITSSNNPDSFESLLGILEKVREKTITAKEAIDQFAEVVYNQFSTMSIPEAQTSKAGERVFVPKILERYNAYTYGQAQEIFDTHDFNNFLEKSATRAEREFFKKFISSDNPKSKYFLTSPYFNFDKDGRTIKSLNIDRIKEYIRFRGPSLSPEDLQAEREIDDLRNALMDTFNIKPDEKSGILKVTVDQLSEFVDKYPLARKYLNELVETKDKISQQLVDNKSSVRLINRDEALESDLERDKKRLENFESYREELLSRHSTEVKKFTSEKEYKDWANGSRLFGKPNLTITEDRIYAELETDIRSAHEAIEKFARTFWEFNPIKIIADQLEQKQQSFDKNERDPGTQKLYKNEYSGRLPDHLKGTYGYTQTVEPEIVEEGWYPGWAPPITQDTGEETYKTRRGAWKVWVSIEKPGSSYIEQKDEAQESTKTAEVIVENEEKKQQAIKETEKIEERKIPAWERFGEISDRQRIKYFKLGGNNLAYKDPDTAPGDFLFSWLPEELVEPYSNAVDTANTPDTLLAITKVLDLVTAGYIDATQAAEMFKQAANADIYIDLASNGSREELKFAELLRKHVIESGKGDLIEQGKITRIDSADLYSELLGSEHDRGFFAMNGNDELANVRDFVKRIWDLAGKYPHLLEYTGTKDSGRIPFSIPSEKGDGIFDIFNESIDYIEKNYDKRLLEQGAFSAMAFDQKSSREFIRLLNGIPVKLEQLEQFVDKYPTLQWYIDRIKSRDIKRIEGPVEGAVSQEATGEPGQAERAADAMETEAQTSNETTQQVLANEEKKQQAIEETAREREEAAKRQKSSEEIKKEQREAIEKDPKAFYESIMDRFEKKLSGQFGGRDKFGIGKNDYFVERYYDRIGSSEFLESLSEAVDTAATPAAMKAICDVLSSDSYDYIFGHPLKDDLAKSFLNAGSADILIDPKSVFPYEKTDLARILQKFIRSEKATEFDALDFYKVILSGSYLDKDKFGLPRDFYTNIGTKNFDNQFINYLKKFSKLYGDLIEYVGPDIADLENRGTVKLNKQNIYDTVRNKDRSFRSVQGQYDALNIVKDALHERYGTYEIYGRTPASLEQLEGIKDVDPIVQKLIDYIKAQSIKRIEGPTEGATSSIHQDIDREKPKTEDMAEEAQASDEATSHILANEEKKQQAYEETAQKKESTEQREVAAENLGDTLNKDVLNSAESANEIIANEERKQQAYRETAQAQENLIGQKTSLPIDAEALYSQIDRVSTILENLMNQLTSIGDASFAGLIESINQLTDGIAKLITMAEGLKDIKVSFDETGITSLKEQFESIFNMLTHLKIVPDSNNGFRIIADTTEQIEENMDQANKKAAELVDKTAEYNEQKQPSKVTSTYVDSESGTVTTVTESAKSEGELAASSQKVTESFDAEKQQTDSLAESNLKLAKAKNAVASVNADIEEQQRRLRRNNLQDTQVYKDLDAEKERLLKISADYEANPDNDIRFQTDLEYLKADLKNSEAESNNLLESTKQVAETANQAGEKVRETTENLFKMRAQLDQVKIDKSNVDASYKKVLRELSNSPQDEKNIADQGYLKSMYLELDSLYQKIRTDGENALQADIDNYQKLNGQIVNYINNINRRLAAEKQVERITRRPSNNEPPTPPTPPNNNPPKGPQDLPATVDYTAQLREALKHSKIVDSNYWQLQNAKSKIDVSPDLQIDLDETQQKYRELITLLQEVKQAGKDVTLDQINNIEKCNQELEENIRKVRERVEAEKKAQKEAQSGPTVTDTQAMNAYEKSLDRIETALKRFSAAKYSHNESSRIAYENLENEKRAIKDLYTQYTDGGMALDEFYEKLNKINADTVKYTSVIKTNGDANVSLVDKFKNMTSSFAQYFSVAQVMMYAVDAMRKMVTTTIELDTAMTELKKVTDESESVYDKFLVGSYERATNLGTSLTDIVSSTADFARLGFDIDEASNLADVATVYKNVGDGISDISEASESIIATMQAFGIEATDAMSIVDKFNAVGNKYAVSSKGIGEALLRSASAMKAANNTLDETIALTAAANTIVQDPEKVGMIDA